MPNPLAEPAPPGESIPEDAAPPAAPAPWLGGRSFGIDLTRFGGAVGLAAVLNVVQVFALPKLLDVEVFGALRVFIVYGVYAGLLHFGLADGAYVRWAGRPAAQVRHEWRRSVVWVLAIQAAIVMAASAMALWLDSHFAAVMVVGVATFAAAANLWTHSTYALQATGDFKRAGLLAVLPPAGVLAGVALLPAGSRNVGNVLAVAVAAQALPAALAAAWLLLAERRDDRSGDPAITPQVLVLLGLPVLGANLAAGLALSADRLMLSLAIPVEQFALYGFAASAMVVAHVATQSLARVAIPHAARAEAGSRSAFYGRLYALIAAGFGLGLALYPALAAVVGSQLPRYVDALPIIRAMLPGALFGVALQVVVSSSLLVQRAVRLQLLVMVLAAALVAAATGIAVEMALPLAGVAASASAALALAWSLAVWIVRRSAGLERCSWAARFALCGVAQVAALEVALAASGNTAMRTAVYAALAAVPTWVAIRRARSA